MLLYQEFTHEQEVQTAQEALFFQFLSKAVKVTDKIAYAKNGIRLRYAR
jgi:hypothetical protein